MLGRSAADCERGRAQHPFLCAPCPLECNPACDRCRHSRDGGCAQYALDPHPTLVTDASAPLLSFAQHTPAQQMRLRQRFCSVCNQHKPVVPTSLLTAALCTSHASVLLPVASQPPPPPSRSPSKTPHPLLSCFATSTLGVLYNAVQS